MSKAVKCLILLAVVALFFVTELIPLAITAMGGAIACGLLGLIPAKQVFSGLSNSTVVLFAGMFVVGGAMFYTGLAQFIGNKVVSAVGTGENSLMFGLMTVGTVLSFCFLPHTLPPLSLSRSIELRSSTCEIIREKTKNPIESDVINGKMPRLRYGWMLAGLQTAVYLCGKIVSPRSCRMKISASGIRLFVDEKCYIVTKKVR